jgi:crotonobetainyl-CoA:carnitine CoA-transferase CaiB-like acyl-CoA transferase
LGGSLAGLRILDLADESAAFAGRILADLGADVIRVEPPGGGSLRKLAPFLRDAPEPDGSFHHLYLNANKRSVFLDLEDAADRATFHSLVTTGDALIETGRPGYMASIGLGFQQLQELNPGIVYASVTPFGQHGEWCDRTGNDLVAVAAGGLLHQSGEPGFPPVLGGTDVAYRMAGVVSAAGILVALTGRDAGEAPRSGVHLDISLQECVRMTILEVANPNLFRWWGRVPARPYMRVFRCQDGKWVGILVRPDRFAAFLAWVRETGVETDLTDADWAKANIDAPKEERARVYALVERLAAAHPLAEFVARALATEQMCLPVLDFPGLRDEEHLRVNRQFIPVDHGPDVRSIDFPRSPVDGFGGVEIRRAPHPGEHTAEILAGLPRPEQRRAPRPEPPAFDPARPLAGIRVIDLSWVFAGPLGPRILANFGAEVIKIESRARIDPLRNEVRFDGAGENASATFNQANTGKLSVTLDLTTAAGQDIARRLIAKSDLVVNNFRPGVMEKLGLDYASLRALDPKVILVNLPGCGREGPWARVGTMGNLIMAASGLNSVTGFPEMPPTGVGTALPDFVVPYLTVATSLAALRERRRNGVGREITINQLSAAISLLGVEWLRFAATGTAPARRSNRDPNYCPHGVYPAAGEDRWLALAVRGEAQWAAFVRTARIEALATDARFHDHAARKANEDALDARITAWTRAGDRWELANQLQSAGIPAAAVEDLRDTMDTDPHLRHHFERVESPPSEPTVPVWVDGEAIRFAGFGRRLARAPMFGEHTEVVLRDLAGVDEASFARLLLEGVIG